MYYNIHQRPKAVAEAKFVVWLFSALGVSLYGYAIFLNITTWKSDVLFVVALGFAFIRLHFYIKQKNQALRKEDEESEMRRLKIMQEKQKIQ
jgi:hypothetical protein